MRTASLPRSDRSESAPSDFRFHGDLQIHKAEASDLDEACRFEETCFEPVRRDDRKALLRGIVDPVLGTWFVRDREGRLIASVSLRPFRNSLRIYSVAVAPSARGSGIGSELLRFAEGVAAGRGFDTVVLEASADRSDLIRWYNRNGFRESSRLEDFYGKGLTAVRFRKTVAAAEV